MFASTGSGITTKIGAAVAAALIAPLLFIAAGVGAVAGTQQESATKPTADIPSDYKALYKDAATTCPGLDWTILAAIGDVESDHGRSTLPGVHQAENSKGAGGPMQFLTGTFDDVIAHHPSSPGGATPPSRYNPHDAIYAAAAYLCDSGARDNRDLRAAIWQYNHADWYVNDIIARARHYADDETPASAAQKAVEYAMAQIGLAYVWGGNGPQDGGFDCSGLTAAAYDYADITLPRQAQGQYEAGPRVPDEEALQPGDLVFYGIPGNIHHVGLYIGNGKMVNAATFRTPVGISPVRYRDDDYAGAARPVN